MNNLREVKKKKTKNFEPINENENNYLPRWEHWGDFFFLTLKKRKMKEHKTLQSKRKIKF